MEDLTSMLKPDPVSALVPTSQQGGNNPHQNNAMTAPGGDPAGGLGADVSEAPVVETQPRIKPGTDGHPQPGQWSQPGEPAWTNPPAHSN